MSEEKTGPAGKWGIRGSDAQKYGAEAEHLRAQLERERAAVDALLSVAMMAKVWLGGRDAGLSEAFDSAIEAVRKSREMAAE